MPNINIAIPEDVHKRLKLKAVQKDSTLKAYIIKALEEEL